MGIFPAVFVFTYLPLTSSVVEKKQSTLFKIHQEVLIAQIGPLAAV